MCGIAGFVGNGDRTDLEAMTRALAHRGPDGEGFHEDPETNVFLGHRRLSIIDIAGGYQPMWNEDGTVAVVFNGEIYNHLDLRRELESRGHRFASDHSDTEVLVHGYEEWGEDLPLRLNGMFGFAIWDSAKRRLFLARDRFGEKPLYWAHQGGLFLFASELSALAAHRGFEAAVDRLALKKFFAHGFFPAPNAFFRDCRKLPPGHWLSYDLAGGEVRVRRYWEFCIEFEPLRSEAEAAEELRHLLRQSVQRRLMSDVPLGIFLSGGIDSGAVAAFVQHLREPGSIHSFSIGFHEKSFDESPFARAMAKAAGCRHHEEIFDLEGARDLIPEVLTRLDEPLGDASLLPTYFLSRFTAGHVRVALSGDGGDELFAGYDTFAALAPARLYHALVPRALNSGLRRLVDLLPKSGRNMSLDFKLGRVLGGMSYPPKLWNPVWLAPLEPGEIIELFEEPTTAEELYSEVLDVWRGSPGAGLVDKTLEFYTRFYLPDDILTKVDRASMMNGLEVRSVFLDNDLVDFVRRLPAACKIRRGQRKYILKKALEGLVPNEILRRPKKGFGIPLMTWLKDLSLSPEGGKSFALDEDTIARKIAEHQAGRGDHRLFLWCWAVLSQRPG